MQRLNWTSEIISPGWIPVDIDGLRPIVRWMNVGKATLSAPMFERSIANLRRDNCPEVEAERSLLTSGTPHLPSILIESMSFRASSAFKTGVFPMHDMFRPADRCRWIHGDHLAGDKKMEEHSGSRPCCFTDVRRRRMVFSI